MPYLFSCCTELFIYFQSVSVDERNKSLEVHNHDPFSRTVQDLEDLRASYLLIEEYLILSKIHFPECGAAWYKHRIIRVNNDLVVARVTKPNVGKLWGDNWGVHFDDGFVLGLHGAVKNY